MARRTVTKRKTKSARKAAGKVPEGLHPIDSALLEVARTGAGRVLTADEWQTLRTRIGEQRDATGDELDALLASCPYDTRLAVTAWAFRHLCAHAEEGGSFRHLIYSRLDFGLDAYATLYLAGGMTLSNLFHNAREQGVLPVAPGDE